MGRFGSKPQAEIRLNIVAICCRMRAEYFDGVDLDKDNEALFTAVTPAEVRRLAREILAQGNRYTAVFTQE